ncbi:hypothetical protein U0070_014712 [Myodes glareolus]|uniref:Olfactory receptor n=1 Tax=Myodes glareolus TaxID=447135 RepID=A0AAW0HWS7_MYOGA
MGGSVRRSNVGLRLYRHPSSDEGSKVTSKIFISMVMKLNKKVNLKEIMYLSSWRLKIDKSPRSTVTKMAMKNDSTVTEFVLTGLTDQSELLLPLFILFLVNHTVTVVGNLSLMSLIFINSDLQTPMYFFLFNLSFIDLCYSFVFTPKTLMSFVSEKNTISFTGCMTQLFFFCFFANSECYVLTAMAYDRYVAICQPLLYMVIMSPRTCSLMMFGSYFMGFAGAIVHTGFMIRLNFCDSNIINHYLCDIFPLLQLSCSSTYANELVSSVVIGTVVIASSVVILMSYALILFNVTQLSSDPASDEGWRYSRKPTLQHGTEPPEVQMRSRRRKNMKNEVSTARDAITH